MTPSTPPMLLQEAVTSRIHRGFHRIGVVLAVPVLLLDVALVIGGQIKSALPLIGFAIFVYATARAIGWVLDGFLSPRA